jgi:HSP20 family protein
MEIAPSVKIVRRIINTWENVIIMPEKKRRAKKTTDLVPTRNAADFYPRELDRILSDFERRFATPFYTRPFGGGWMGPRWWRSFAEFPDTRHAFADLIDSGSEYRVRVEVPGIPKDKINISVTPKEIKIDGEAETNIDETKEGFVHRERSYSSIKKELPFPEEVIPDMADASVKDGILEVKVPKKNPTEMKTHKVQVK